MATRKTSSKKAEPVLALGKNVFIRTVTHYYTGRVAFIDRAKNLLVLEDAAWIADTGRFADAMRDGTASEIEPFTNPVEINLASMVDATLWVSPLPRVQK
jgi:hypothetical protein